VPIPAFITGLTGIDDAMVEHAPRFERIAAELAQRLHGRLLIAHNVRFDYGFLRAEFARAGIDFSMPVLCSARLSRKLYAHEPRHNLDALIARHGLVCEARHRAIGDALVIGGFLDAALGEHGSARVREVAQALTVAGSAPRSGLELIDQMPDAPGCFVLRAADATVLYVGGGASLRLEAQRVLQRSSALGRTLAAEAVAVEIERHPGVLGAALAEQRLRDALAPRHRAPRNGHDRLDASRLSWSLEWRADAQPEFRLVQSLPALDDPDGDAERFGDFPDERVARSALRAFAREHQLDPVLLGLDTPAPAAPASAAGEPASARSIARARALSALARLPRATIAGHRGLLAYRETGTGGDAEIQVFDGPRYLGAARDEGTLDQLLGTRNARAPDAADQRALRILERLLARPGIPIERIRLGAGERAPCGIIGGPEFSE
jgi:DNA polymerase III subunit epsilon